MPAHRPRKDKDFIMKLSSSIARLGAAAMLPLCFSLSALADEKWYVGASLGTAKANIDRESVSAGLLFGGITTGGGMTTTAINTRADSTSGRLFGGYRLNQRLGLEGGYFDLGTFGFTAETTPTGTLTGQMKAAGLAVDAVGTWPLTQAISAVGRVGLALTRVENRFGQTGSVVVLRPDWNKTALGLKGGAGFEYAVSKPLKVRLEAEVYRINDAVGGRQNVRMLSIGIAYAL